MSWQGWAPCCRNRVDCDGATARGYRLNGLRRINTCKIRYSAGVLPALVASIPALARLHCRLDGRMSWTEHHISNRKPNGEITTSVILGHLKSLGCARGKQSWPVTTANTEGGILNFDLKFWKSLADHLLNPAVEFLLGDKGAAVQHDIKPPSNSVQFCALTLCTTALSSILLN